MVVEMVLDAEVTRKLTTYTKSNATLYSVLKLDDLYRLSNPRQGTTHNHTRSLELGQWPGGDSSFFNPYVVEECGYLPNAVRL
jgi:hypothetical protein